MTATTSQRGTVDVQELDLGFNRHRVTRTVRNVTRNYDGSLSGTVQLNGGEYNVRKNKRARIWTVVD